MRINSRTSFGTAGPGPEKAVSGCEFRALDGALEHADLMAQGEDL
jgi:hypothetical protein